MMRDFAAIDFETANEYPSSVCSVGIVVVRGGEIMDRFYSLIHPEPEYYQWFCRQVHGLGPEDTEDAPVFRQVFRVYRMDYPDYTFYDTLSASRRHFGRLLPNHQLQTVAAACGYDLMNHHHALADAEACAYIAMKLL